jgi:hypothetical protein
MPAQPQQTPDLRAIVYVSSATIDFTEPELENLLSQARESNLQNGVTGILLFSDGNFMQYFEGLEAAVSETWQRIRNSKRHTGIIELFP